MASVMSSPQASEPVQSTTQLWLASIPGIGSFAVLGLWNILPHSAFRFGSSGFDAFNVWIILSGPVAVLALRTLRRSSLSLMLKLLLGIVNAGAVFLSLCLLLVAAGK